MPQYGVNFYQKCRRCLTHILGQLQALHGAPRRRPGAAAAAGPSVTPPSIAAAAPTSTAPRRVSPRRHPRSAGMEAPSGKGVGLARKMQVGPCIPVGIQP